MHYPSFKDGYIAFVLQFEDGEEEVIEVFNKMIKMTGLIYSKNKWAIYEERMMEISKNLKSVGIKIGETTMKEVDLRIGMITLVPTLHITPDIINLSLDSNYPIYVESLSSYLDTEQIYNVHLAWTLSPSNLYEIIKYYRVYRDGAFIGTTRRDKYFVRNVDKTKTEFKIEALNFRGEIISELVIKPHENNQ